MNSLKSQLSENGFTSSESYDHAITCFLNNPTNHIRCLHVDGDSGRRRSAFAHALAKALQAPQVIYHEFGKDKPVPQVIRILEGEEVIEELSVDALDRVITDACAQSEAVQTVLILDQLHKTPFLNHIRLYEFLQTGQWQYSDVQFQANLLNLSVYLISDEPLYHSLQSAVFRLWVGLINPVVVDISAAELGLSEQECSWLAPMLKLMKKIKLTPTLEEYRHLAFDINRYVHNQQQLKASIFGWIENCQYTELNDDDLLPVLSEIIDAVLKDKGIQEEIEIFSR